MKKRWILLILPLMMALMMNAASASELLGNVLSLVLNSPDAAVLADDCRADAEGPYHHSQRSTLSADCSGKTGKRLGKCRRLDKRRLSAVGGVWRADAHADGRRL